MRVGERASQRETSRVGQRINRSIYVHVGWVAWPAAHVSRGKSVGTATDMAISRALLSCTVCDGDILHHTQAPFACEGRRGWADGDVRFRAASGGDGHRVEDGGTV